MTYSFEPSREAPADETFRPDVEERFEPAENVESSAKTAADREESLERLRADAFASGRSQGFRDAAAELEPAADALREAAARLAEQQVAWLHAQRSLLAELAIEIAERIVGDALEAKPEHLATRIASALALTEPNEVAIVELSASDHSAVAELFETERLGGAIELAINPSLSPGDVMVRQGAATLDARIETLLAGTRAALAGLETIAEPPTEEELS